MTEHQHDVTAETEQSTNPVALSLVGGFVGTVTGLKRHGVPGAVVGGLVGGSVGYVGGTALNRESMESMSEAAEPVTVSVADDSGADDIEIDTDGNDIEVDTGDDTELGSEEDDTDEDAGLDPGADDTGADSDEDDE